MNKKVCGADVCQDKIVCCFVTQPVRRIKEEFKDGDHEFFEFKVTMEDVTRFLEHKPTHLVLEPTGTNYAWIWAEIATQNGIEVLWERLDAISKARKSLAKDLKKVLDAATLRSIQDSVAASIQVEVKPKQKAVDAKKRWARLINARTTAKLGELIWKELLDELYPKLGEPED